MITQAGKYSDGRKIKMASSLRRYYPDQVLRVFLSKPPHGGKHPGNTSM
jgi:hypothetical protein